MPKLDKEDFELDLNQPAQANQARDVLRVLRYLINRMKLESRKSWKTDDLIELCETMITEIVNGVTEEDKLRQIYNARGKTAFGEGVPRERNPHPPGSDYAKWWDIGWHDGEREQRAAEGGAVTIQQGRIKAATGQQAVRYYKVRVQRESMICEWNEVLHQYSAEGQGTLFADYDEALVLADQLRRAGEGIVSVVAVDAKKK